MSETRDETGMDVMEVFAHFERLSKKAGVRVHIADYDPDTGRRGFGIGMLGVQKRFMRDPEPTLIIGLDEKGVLAKPEFESLLALPCVRYLELPFTRDEFKHAAESVRDIKINKAELEGVRKSVTELSIKNIRSNVAHRLNGAILVTLNEAVALCRQAVIGKIIDMSAHQKKLVERITSLASVDETVRGSLAILDREIGALDGVCAPVVSNVLCAQRTLLETAADDLGKFVTGVAAWARGEATLQSLTEFANTGEKVIEAFKNFSTVLGPLSGKGREG
jgi:hypothetical protein